MHSHLPFISNLHFGDMLARFFIDRPIFATVVSVVITLCGGIAMVALPIAQYPQITPPSVSLSISYPGANAQVVQDTIAAPIEQAVNGVQGMLYMSSTSGSDGSYSLSITFEVGTNLNTALVMVQNRVALALPLLPTEVQAQGITVRKKSPDQLMIISFYSSDENYIDRDLSNFALINLKDEILRVPGVSDVSIMGERDYSIRIWLDPRKLASRGMTAMDVATAVRNQSIQAARRADRATADLRATDEPVADRYSGPAQHARTIRRHRRQGRRPSPRHGRGVRGLGRRRQRYLLAQLDQCRADQRFHAGEHRKQQQHVASSSSSSTSSSSTSSSGVYEQRRSEQQRRRHHAAAAPTAPAGRPGFSFPSQAASGTSNSLSADTAASSGGAAAGRARRRAPATC